MKLSGFCRSANKRNPNEFAPSFIKKVETLEHQNQQLLKAIESWKKEESIWLEFNQQLIEAIENLPENKPLYKDSGLFQLRSDDMEDVVEQQGVNEPTIDFIKRITKLI